MEQIVTCPHCGNETTHEIIHKVETSEKAFSTSDSDNFFEFDVTYYLTKCKTCFQISLFGDSEIDEIQGKLCEAGICYPRQSYFGDEVPETIKQTYNEARRIKNILPTAFAVLIRRGLEFLCIDKKAKGQTLYKQLEDLGQTGIIPRTLVEMGDTLRFLGNKGAHATNYKIGITEVQAMNDFFIAMLEYVYIAPAKLNRLRETIKLKQKE